MIKHRVIFASMLIFTELLAGLVGYQCGIRKAIPAGVWIRLEKDGVGLRIAEIKNTASYSETNLIFKLLTP